MKGIYPTIKVTTNISCPLCSQKEWKMMNGVGLQTYELVDYQKWLPIATNYQYPGQSKK